MNVKELRHFEDLKDGVMRAEAKMISALQEKYPPASSVSFFIMHGQVNPSTGIVVGYDGQGHVRVRHDQAKEHSRYRIRDVHFRKIL